VSAAILYDGLARKLTAAGRADDVGDVRAKLVRPIDRGDVWSAEGSQTDRPALANPFRRPPRQLDRAYPFDAEPASLIEEIENQRR
jgi:hypothetical protein